MRILIFYHYQQLVALRRGKLEDLMVYAAFARWIRFRFRTTRMRLCTRTPVPVVRMAAPRTSPLLVVSNFTAEEQERDFAVLSGGS